MMAYGTRQLALGVAIVLGNMGYAQAASLPHPGPVVVQDGVYDNIVETSVTNPLPMFGAPSAGAGNTMTFPMPSFTATASDNAVDLVAGALEFTFDADPGLFVNTLSIFESGAYDVTGAGGTVSVSGALTLRYFDDLTQQFVTLADPIHLVVSPGGVPGGAFPVDSTGMGTWLGAALIDLGGLGIQSSHVILAMDNILAASALPSGTVTISKDELTINTTLIPEPASVALMGMGLALIFRRGA
jgi:hypothetical protein